MRKQSKVRVRKQTKVRVRKQSKVRVRKQSNVRVRKQTKLRVRKQTNVRLRKGNVSVSSPEKTITKYFLVCFIGQSQVINIRHVLLNFGFCDGETV